jgi:hypothetical protein
MKRRNPLSLHGVIRAGIDELGGASEAAVVLPHRKATWLNHAADPDLAGTRQEARLTYEDVRAMSRAGAKAFSEDLARLCGCALKPLEGDQPVGLMAGSATIMRETAEAMSAISVCLKDGKISASERDAIVRELMDVVRVTSNLLSSMEAS